jgi:glutathione S-transferase
MDFYYGQMSGNSARAAFGAPGAPFHARLVDTGTGANRAAVYLAFNPIGNIG